MASETQKSPGFGNERWGAYPWVLWDVGDGWGSVLYLTGSLCGFSHQNVPFYIFSESYGGKMAAGIALELHKVSSLRM